MLSAMRQRVSPALVGASVAVFFAVAGSAFAIGGRSDSKSAPAPVLRKCATGTIKGIAYVTGDPKKGLENLPETYTGAAIVFGARWSCTGGAVQVKRSGKGFDVRFVGNSAGTALGNVIGGTPGTVAVNRAADAFHVTVAAPRNGGAPEVRSDVPFVIIAL